MGGGSWATAIAKIILKNEPDIVWYMRREDQIEDFKRLGHNPAYLSSVMFETDRIEFTTKINQAVQKGDILVFATPSPFFKQHLKRLRRRLDNKVIVSAIKGIVPDENMLISEYFNKVYGVPFEKICALSGPCHAEEVALERNSYLTVACPDRELARTVAQMVTNNFVASTTSDDVYGVEYSSVMKNIYAIAAGICHGLKYGDNFQAVLVSNAIQEMNRFCNAVYPFHRNLQESVYLGDLLVTADEKGRRKRTFGTRRGKGEAGKREKGERERRADGEEGRKGREERKDKEEGKRERGEEVYAVLYQRRSPVNVMRELATKLQ